MKKFFNVITWIFGFPFRYLISCKKKGKMGTFSKILFVPIFVIYLMWMFVFTAACAGVVSGVKGDGAETAVETSIESQMETQVETEEIDYTVAESSAEETIIVSETEQTTSVDTASTSASATSSETTNESTTTATTVETTAEPVVTTETTIIETTQEQREYIRNKRNGKIHRTTCSFGPEEQNRETIYLTDDELKTRDFCQRCFK